MGERSGEGQGMEEEQLARAIVNRILKKKGKRMCLKRKKEMRK